MGLAEVKRRMDEMEELYEVVDNRGSFHAILTRIHIGVNEWKEPFK